MTEPAEQLDGAANARLAGTTGDASVSELVPARRTHPTVRLNYIVRITTFPLYLLLYVVHMWGRHVPTLALVVFLVHLLVSPHIAMRIATRSRDPKRAEQRNLLVDSFLIGCYIPLTGFSIWPSAAGVLGINAGNISVGGPRLAWRGLVLAVAGALIVGFLTGFKVDIFAASTLTEMLSIAVIGAYTTVYGLGSYLQSRKVTRVNRRIREQSAQMEHDSALLAERSTQLERALVEAEAANDAKSRFLANMSHELRTPLNSIIGFTNIILRDKEGKLEGQPVEYLHRVRSNGMHLLTLINGVLDLAKIEALESDLELTMFDVVPLIRETIAEIEPQAQLRGIELAQELPEAALLVADRPRLKQMIFNLVGNAVKFTERGRVTIRLETDPRSGAPLQMDVIDTGVGIPADRLQAVFEAFQQADTTTARQYGGTGLGLTITRSLAELMGWRILASSELGVGSTFSVDFSPERSESVA